jgi:hypothetical protein
VQLGSNRKGRRENLAILEIIVDKFSLFVWQQLFHLDSSPTQCISVIITCNYYSQMHRCVFNASSSSPSYRKPSNQKDLNSIMVWFLNSLFAAHFRRAFKGFCWVKLLIKKNLDWKVHKWNYFYCSLTREVSFIGFVCYSRQH